MEVVRLGPVGSTAYLPDELVEGYTSCIWAERHSTDGDFTIKSPRVEEMQKLLPENTLVSHLDTDQVMIVEDHIIENDEDDVPEITITGRALTSFGENRVIGAQYGQKRLMRRTYNPAQAAEVLLWNIFANGSGKDVTRGDTNPNTAGEYNDYSWPVQDRIPNAIVTDSVTADGSVRRWWLEQGIALPQLRAILDTSDLGFRVLRPNGRSATVITVDSDLATRGTVRQAWTTDIQQLRFDVYRGLDRSDTQTANAVVRFSILQGDLDNAQHLFSRRPYKTTIVSGSSLDNPFRAQGGTYFGVRSVLDAVRTNTGSLTGLNRRVGHRDAGSPEIPTEPQKPQELYSNAGPGEIRSRSQAMDKWLAEHYAWEAERVRIENEFREDALKDALTELKRAARKTVVSGDISPYSAYQYGRDYNLGDIVTLNGNYGLTEKVVVSEYIRTEDANGDRGYPGLTTIE